MRWRSKTTEKDAPKRALATFGNPFGLTFYDGDQTKVTNAREEAGALVARSWPLDARASGV